MPPRVKNDREPPNSSEKKNALIRILRMPHVHWGSSQMDLKEPTRKPWKYAEGYHDIASTPQDVPDLENDRGRPNLPKAYRLYNK